MSCLLLLITLRFTSSERKMYSNIKNSENIMNMIVFKIFFCFNNIFNVLYNSSNCYKQSYFGWNVLHLMETEDKECQLMSVVTMPRVAIVIITFFF